jgi:hypothetical protein
MEDFVLLLFLAAVAAVYLLAALAATGTFICERQDWVRTTASEATTRLTYYTRL